MTLDRADWPDAPRNRPARALPSQCRVSCAPPGGTPPATGRTDPGTDTGQGRGLGRGAARIFFLAYAGAMIAGAAAAIWIRA